jgi:O-antigen ligase
VLVFVMAGTLHIVLNILPDLEDAPLRAMAAGALVGLTASGAVLSLEVFSDQLLRRLLIRIVPALQPDPRHLTMEGAQLARLAPYLTNANISVLTLMFWPAALMATRFGLLQTAHRWLAITVSGIVIATVFASENATSQVAFVGAAVTFLLFRVRPKLAMPLMIAGWVSACLLVVPVSSALFGAEVHRAAWLPESARHRVVIWRYTSEQIRKAPLLGAGVSTSRALHEAAGGERPMVPGTAFRLSPSWHSHNAYLQVWYETGAIGALISLGLGLLVLRTLTRLPPDVQPYLVATFAAGALSIATSYSIWAPWLMASLAMASIFATLGAAVAESEPLRPPRAS